MAAQASAVEVARKRLLEIEKRLNSIIIGHESMVRALLLASVAGEHAVIIGPPGTAKSYLVRSLSRLVSAEFYSYLLTRFTSYDELFGAVDIVELSKGTFKRNWSRITSADFVFLDEIFKANSAILNALLSLLQERIVYDPVSGQAVPARLHTAVGASNEAPEDPELEALYDRFAVRVFVNYLDEDALLLRALEARWAGNGAQSLAPVASMDDVKALHSYAASLLNAKIKGLDGKTYAIFHANAIPLIKQLRKEGVLVSDRTVVEKLPKLFSAYLALYGVTMENVMNGVFDVAVYCARTAEQLTAIRKVIHEALGEVAELAAKLEEAKKLITAMNLQKAKEKLIEVINADIAKLAQKAPWLRPRAEAVVLTARQLLQGIERMEQELVKLAGTTAEGEVQ